MAASETVRLDLAALIITRLFSKCQGTCFSRSSFDEPLLAIMEISVFGMVEMVTVKIIGPMWEGSEFGEVAFSEPYESIRTETVVAESNVLVVKWPI